MRFNPKARLDRGRVKDTGRGSGRGGGLPGGSGRRVPIPGGAAGGGIGGLLIVALAVVLIQVLSGGDGGGYSSSWVDDATDTGRYDDCRTGEDANESQDCARVAVENSLTDFWESELGDRFRSEGRLVTFTGQANTACGAASTPVGPFYCPADESIYLDTDFLGCR